MFIKIKKFLFVLTIFGQQKMLCLEINLCVINYLMVGCNFHKNILSEHNTSTIDWYIDNAVLKKYKEYDIWSENQAYIYKLILTNLCDKVLFRLRIFYQ